MPCSNPASRLPHESLKHNFLDKRPTLPHLWLTSSSRVSPLITARYFSSCLSDSPHGGHPALRSTASRGSSSALAVSSFRLRARLDVCIPSAFFGQRGITPAFGYGAPHLSARGTSTLLDYSLLSTRFAYSALASFRMGMRARVRIGVPLPYWHILFVARSKCARREVGPLQKGTEFQNFSNSARAWSLPSAFHRLIRH